MRIEDNKSQIRFGMNFASKRGAKAFLVSGLNESLSAVDNLLIADELKMLKIKPPVDGKISGEIFYKKIAQLVKEKTNDWAGTIFLKTIKSKHGHTRLAIEVKTKEGKLYKTSCRGNSEPTFISPNELVHIGHSRILTKAAAIFKANENKSETTEGLIKLVTENSLQPISPTTSSHAGIRKFQRLTGVPYRDL